MRMRHEAAVGIKISTKFHQTHQYVHELCMSWTWAKPGCLRLYQRGSYCKHSELLFTTSCKYICNRAAYSKVHLSAPQSKEAAQTPSRSESKSNKIFHLWQIGPTKRQWQLRRHYHGPVFWNSKLAVTDLWPPRVGRLWAFMISRHFKGGYLIIMPFSGEHLVEV